MIPQYSQEAGCSFYLTTGNYLNAGKKWQLLVDEHYKKIM